MARLIPARPKTLSTANELAILTLERELDDTFVMIQPSPMIPGIIVLHPEAGAIGIVGVDEALSFNADLDDWVNADGSPSDVVRLKERVVQTLAASPGIDRGSPDCLLFSPLTKQGGFDANLVNKATRLAERVKMGNSRPMKIDIDTILGVLAPGAEKYTPGNVTKLQTEWRKNRHGFQSEQLVEAPVVATDDAPASASTYVPVSKRTRREEPRPSLQHHIRMLEAIVAQASEGKPIYIAGSVVPLSVVTQPNYFLPAFLIVAAENWAPVVASRSGKGGFYIEMRHDPTALLGYVVTDIQLAAPLLGFLPMAHLIRKSIIGGDVDLDHIAVGFADWLIQNNMDAEITHDLDVRVLLT